MATPIYRIQYRYTDKPEYNSDDLMDPSEFAEMYPEWWQLIGPVPSVLQKIHAEYDGLTVDIELWGSMSKLFLKKE